MFEERREHAGDDRGSSLSWLGGAASGCSSVCEAALCSASSRLMSRSRGHGELEENEKEEDDEREGLKRGEMAGFTPPQWILII
jgi:hypothetical protein